MTLALAALLLAASAVPHVLRLDRSPPALAITIWTSALALRALMAVFAAIFFVLYVPTTELFSAVTHWCLHAVVPLLAAHLPLHGHRLGGAAVIAPAFFLAASLLSMVVGLWRATRRVRTLLRHAVVGRGPRESLLLADGDVVVAAAGLRRPRVVISAGALLRFDDEELAASLDHEQGHIAHRHRYVLVFGELCRALARLLPGTRAAARELAFHLERDADRYALERAHEPAALASAICKAAGASPPAVGFALGGGVAARRVRLLLDEHAAPRRRGGLPIRLTALGMVTVALAALPAAAHAGLHTAAKPVAAQHCDDRSHSDGL